MNTYRVPLRWYRYATDAEKAKYLPQTAGCLIRIHFRATLTRPIG